MTISYEEMDSIKSEREVRLKKMIPGFDGSAPNNLWDLSGWAATKTGEMLDGLMVHPNVTATIQRRLEEKALDLLEHHVIPAIRRNVG